MAKPETEEAAIWRLIEPLVRPKVEAAVKRFQERTERTFDEMLDRYLGCAGKYGYPAILKEYIPGRVAEVQLLGQEVSEIFDGARMEAGLDKTTAYERVVFLIGLSQVARAFRQDGEKTVWSIGNHYNENPEPYVHKLRRAFAALEAKWGQASGEAERLRELAESLPVMGLNLAPEVTIGLPSDPVPESPRNRASLRQELQEIADQAKAHFNRAASQSDDESYPLSKAQQFIEELSSRIRRVVEAISHAAKSSPLVSEVDHDSLAFAMKSMVAALKFRRYEHWGPRVESHEDTVLAVHQAGESEDGVIEEVTIARDIFADNCDKVLGFVDLVAVPKPSTQTSKEVAAIAGGTEAELAGPHSHKEANLPGDTPEVSQQREEGNTFRKTDDRFWEVSYEGKTSRVAHVKGMVLLAHLLRCPRQQFSGLQLGALLDGDGSHDADGEKRCFMRRRRTQAGNFQLVVVMRMMT